jgi:hypothetical protein
MSSGRDNRQPETAQEKVKLSTLSLEERMAYYKQKYDKGSAPEAGLPPKEGKGRNRGGRGPDQQEKSNNRGSGGKGGASPRQTGNTQAFPAKTGEAGKKPQENGNAGTAKKGFLSRILGVFGKDKTNEKNKKET